MQRFGWKNNWVSVKEGEKDDDDEGGENEEREVMPLA